MEIFVAFDVFVASLSCDLALRGKREYVGCGLTGLSLIGWELNQGRLECVGRATLIGNMAILTAISTWNSLRSPLCRRQRIAILTHARSRDTKRYNTHGSRVTLTNDPSH